MKRRRPRKLRKKRAEQQVKAQARKQKPVHTDKVKDLHHLCWPRKKWHNGYAGVIRNHWYFKVYIYKNTLHKEIHGVMQGIPVPDVAVAKQAVMRLRTLEHEGRLHQSDSVETRLRLLASLFPKTATGLAFNRQLSVVQHYKPPL